MTMTTSNDVVRILVADDDFDMRLLVKATVGNDSTIEIVGEAADGTAAVEVFRQSRAQVCVLDYRMPGLSGIEAARQILAEEPSTKVLLFSAYLTPEVTAAAESLGVRCLRKDAFMDLPAIIRELADER